MRECPGCGKELVRVHRRPLERALYSDAYACRHCRQRVRVRYRMLRLDLREILSPYTRCLRCGTPDVERLTRRDRVDTMSRHPLSLLCGVTGAPLNWCRGCRLQYYDWRPRAPSQAAHDTGG